MNALLRRFVELIEPDLAAAGFVRRGPVFRYFDHEGNGIALDIQRTTAMWGEVEFFVNAGVFVAPHLLHYFGDDDPSKDVMPHHGVWQHRLAGMTDHTFSLSTTADAERAATIVRTWLAASLPRLKSWLGDYDAMLAAIEEDRARSEQASAEQLATGEWKPGRWPDGWWSDDLIRLYARASRGDVDAVRAETADWDDSLAVSIVDYAGRRRTERQG